MARFMASLFTADGRENASLLDAGAGVGSLTGAFLDRWAEGGFGFKSVDVTACEIDDALSPLLAQVLADYGDRLGVTSHLVGEDFIEYGVNALQFSAGHRYTHAILNPPYKKISGHSRHRLLLRQVGIEAVNLYAAFVALALALMEEGGQVVAILPRSFCNGPYYRPFRKFVLERAAIRHLHLFASRTNAFKEDDVLQENVIVLLERGGIQGAVTISTSTDDRFADYAAHDQPFEGIVLPGDEERVIHVPIGTTDFPSAFGYILEELGVEVSTGPVVDFRLKEHLRDMPGEGTVPLLYPGHFVGGKVEWPASRLKKPNALAFNPATEKWLYPNGFYTVVRRLSSKEESRRIVASVVSPSVFGSAWLGFENHLNVFHSGKSGLPEELARGLAIYLNTSAVDIFFRRFSGHTQVNATDLRRMKYPARETLMELGRWSAGQGTLTQQQVDEKLESLA
ncbi:MAG: Eco57I restriction-modification methylase domain-containing protein [Sulfuricellaceae bacterium]